MDVRRAATRSQGAFQKWRSLEPAAWKFPSAFMCLVQSSDRHAGPFKEQALLAAAATFKHRGCVIRAAKLAVFAREHLGMRSWSIASDTVTGSGKLEGPQWAQINGPASWHWKVAVAARVPACWFQTVSTLRKRVTCRICRTTPWCTCSSWRTTQNTSDCLSESTFPLHSALDGQPHCVGVALVNLACKPTGKTQQRRRQLWAGQGSTSRWSTRPSKNVYLGTGLFATLSILMVTRPLRQIWWHYVRSFSLTTSLVSWWEMMRCDRSQEFWGSMQVQSVSTWLYAYLPFATRLTPPLDLQCSVVRGNSPGLLHTCPG